MSSSVNLGGQQIGWKYSTPLKAEYLNTFISGLTSPGLVTRPRIVAQTTSSGAQVTISPFSMFIEPSDETSSYTDENGNNPIKSLVKITTTTDVLLSVTKETVAIGFEFSFAKESVPQSQWFGSFEVLTSSSAKDYEGIIIATVMNYTSNNVTYYMVRTSGADISDALLREEGFDPNCWLSLVSPRRITTAAGGTGYLNQLEVRKHNKRFEGYMCGHGGCVSLSNVRYNIPTNASTDPNGTRAVRLPNKICLFSLNTSGLSLSDSGANVPIANVAGGTIAVVNAELCVNGSPSTAFANNLRIFPCEKEDVNVYLNSANNTLYIR